MDSKEIIPVEVVSLSELPTSIGEAANNVARQSVLHDYQERKSTQTLRRQKADIALFEQFLAETGSQIEGLSTNLSKWSTVTWVLVEYLNRWQLSNGYANGSVNVRST